MKAFMEIAGKEIPIHEIATVNSHPEVVFKTKEIIDYSRRVFVTRVSCNLWLECEGEILGPFEIPSSTGILVHFVDGFLDHLYVEPTESFSSKLGDECPFCGKKNWTF